MADIVFDLDEVAKPITRDEANSFLLQALSMLGISTTAWGPGDVVKEQMVSASAMFAALSEFQADIVQALFVDSAPAGPWLNIVARYVYGVDPIQATFATGDVVLTNTGGGLFDVATGDLVVRNSITGKAYRNVAAFSLGSNEVATVAVMAQEAGAASNANAGAITSFVTTLNRVTVTNPTALIGVDDEAPAALRARCKEKLGALSPLGPWDAYSYAARNAKLSTGETAGITRTRVTRDGYGNVFVTVATASGEVAGSVDDLATPLGAVDDSIQHRAAPLAVTAHTLSATPVAVTVAYHAYLYNTTGRSADQVKQAVAAALATYFTTLPIGGTRVGDADGAIYVEGIRAVIHNALPEIYYVQLSQPAADVVLTSSQVGALLHNPATHATLDITSQADA